MKIFSLLTFCFTPAFVPLASAEKQDEAKAVKSKSQPAKNQQVSPKVAPSRHVQQEAQIKRNLPPSAVGPRIHQTQPKVRQPVTTVQPNPKIHRQDWQDQPNPKIQRQDWQDQPRVYQKPTVSPRTAPIAPTVRADTDRNRNWDRNDRDSNRNWRNRTSDNSWQNARRRHHRQHRHRDWWRSHYTRFALFGTGYYFWDRGYWYPAYGYDPAYNTYSYEEPIYGYGDLEPAQVIANVQTELQRLGYYRYAVDGQMGPMTRAAIADYQRDQGLAITSAIDEPTLESLGLA